MTLSPSPQISNFKRPEVLSPAGGLSKLKVAVNYGADAVYVGGQKFGLRAASENFTLTELQEGVNYAHARNCKVYVVLNSFFHDSDFAGLDEFLTYLHDIKIDAVIVSDLGVVDYIHKNFPSIDIHLSTQASCLNSYSAHFWKNFGVKRIVLGREVTLSEATEIKKNTGLEIEMFIHGSMCMSYSGNCVISNYTQGRDSNRGGCAHSCRFEYKIKHQQQELNAYFMSSKDLRGVELIPDFFEAQIDSVKIEGRMKGPLYAATTAKIYKESILCYEKIGKSDVFYNKIPQWNEELMKFSHRDYTSGSLRERADKTSIYNKREAEENTYDAIGMVLDVYPGEFLLVEVRKKFLKGEILEVVPFEGQATAIHLEQLFDSFGNPIEFTRPGTLARIPYVSLAQSFNILRRGPVQ